MTLRWLEATRSRSLTIASFVGEDASGSFGLWPGHLPFVTVLRSGLCRFRQDESWEFAATPGAVLHLDRSGLLVIACRRAWFGEDPQQLLSELQRDLQAEENEQQRLRTSFEKLEEQMLQRLGRMSEEPL